MLGKLLPTIIATAPSATMTITPGTLTPSQPGGPPPPPTEGLQINFVEGTPSRVSVASSLPAGKDRYHGGWEAQKSGSEGTTDYWNWLPGVYFDPATKEFVYDGRVMTDMGDSGGVALTPNPGYFVGYEEGPYNSHWPFPPTTSTTPAIVNVGGVNTSQSIHGSSKHTRMVYCSWDQRVYNMGGDYQAANLPTKRGGQDGRMVWWRVDPRTTPQPTWDHYYPEWGNTGEQVPLQCDRMNFDWDPVHQVFWISHGSARMGPLGYFSNSLATALAAHPNGTSNDPMPNYQLEAWQYEAAQYSATFANAVPEQIATPEIPLLVYDPRAITMKYACASPVLNVPWLSTANTNMQSSAFHVASKRLYNIWKGNDGVSIAWLDTTPYPLNPTQLIWQTKNILLTTGSADNLTGTSLHRYVAGVGNGSPCFIDEVKSLLYFLDTGTKPALLGLTLPGHTLGEHKVVTIADLSTAIGYSTGYAGYMTWPTQNRDLPGPLPGYNAGYNCPSGIGACTTSPLIWVPEVIRNGIAVRVGVVVLMLEPSEEEVGPWTRSLEINVDNGTISEGPRYPNSELDGMPWFPNAGFWYPPTEELVLYGIAIMNHDRTGGNRSWDTKVGGETPIPMLWQRYHWQGTP